MPAVIFVADDERAIRGAILKRLTRQGHHAVGYESPVKPYRIKAQERAIAFA